MTNHSTAFTNALTALDMSSDTSETVIAGSHPELVEWIHKQYLPNNVLLWGERDNSPLWEGKGDGAYVCCNQTCGPRATSVEELSAQMN